MKIKKYFNSFRWIAIAALICTAIIIAVMISESVMPGNKSAAQSSKVAASLQEYAGDSFDQTFVGTEPVREVQVKTLHGYTGSRVKAKFSCVPSDARPTEFTYKIGNASVAEVDEDGYITFKKCGQTTLTVTVKDDPSVSARGYVCSYGTHPNDITYAEPPYTTVKEGQIRSGFYLKDQNGDLVNLSSFNVTQDTKCVRLSGEWLTGMSVGKSVVTFSPKGNPDLKFTYEFETLPNSSLVRATGVELTTNEITINKYDVINVKNYIKNIIPSNATNYSFVGGIINPEGKTVMSSVSGEKKRADHEGTATIVISDNVSNQAKAELIVHVVVPTPTKFSVTGERQLQLNYSYSFKAEGDYCDIENVTWSVVEGRAKISENGKLSKTHLGKVTIRATFNDDPSVYADLTVEVKLYTSFAAFVRKALGHFALFCVIGFGLAASFAFLLKPRLASVPVSLVAGFAFALLSETLQLPVFTTGRMFAWSDVLVDFSGALVGMTAAYLAIGTVLLFFRMSKNRRDLMIAFGAVSAKTIFKKTPSFEQSPPASQTANSNSATISDPPKPHDRDND